MVALACFAPTEDCRASIHHLLIELSQSSHSCIALVNAADVQLDRILINYKKTLDVPDHLVQISYVLYELRKKLTALNQNINGLSSSLKKGTVV